MDTEPERGDEVAKWLKHERDKYPKNGLPWTAVDVLLDDYRLHADTGTPLGQWDDYED